MSNDKSRKSKVSFAVKSLKMENCELKGRHYYCIPVQEPEFKNPKMFTIASGSEKDEITIGQRIEL